MKSLKKIVLALCVVPVLAFAGCGESEAVKDMNAIADELCECKDAACAAKASAKLAELGVKHKDTKVTEADKKKVTEAGERAMKCATSAALGGAK
ncbi:MAG: hypothetical protein ACI9OJ_001817 [Myxococcota bacterium]|jgi:hypothetical protein